MGYDSADMAERKIGPSQEQIANANLGAIDPNSSLGQEVALRRSTPNRTIYETAYNRFMQGFRPTDANNGSTLRRVLNGLREAAPALAVAGGVLAVAAACNIGDLHTPTDGHTPAPQPEPSPVPPHS